MKKAFLFAGLAVAVIVTVVSCQKEAAVPGTNEPFDAAVAKEWYYGTFKKSGEWASSASRGKKLPDWKNGTYSKTRDKEIVEFPLVQEKKTVSLINNVNLSDADKKRITEASQSRIVFIKYRNGKVRVRELQYIPDLGYLAAHSYDISENRLGKFDKDFSGMIVSKKWNGEEKARSIVKSGKVTSRFKKMLTASNSSRIQSCAVGDVEVIEWARDDEMHIYGDGMVTYEVGEWYPTGNSWCVSEEETEENPGCDEPGSLECFCELIGGCEEEGGGPSGSACEMTSAEAQSFLAGITGETEFEPTSGSGNETPPDPDGVIRKPVNINRHSVRFHFGFGYSSKYTLNFLGTLYKTNTNSQWKWESLAYNQITKTEGGTPPCVSASVTATVSGPIISSDKKAASFSAQVVLSVTISCLNGMEAGSYTQTVNGEYQSNDPTL